MYRILHFFFKFRGLNINLFLLSYFKLNTPRLCLNIMLLFLIKVRIIGPFHKHFCCLQHKSGTLSTVFVQVSLHGCWPCGSTALSAPCSVRRSIFLIEATCVIQDLKFCLQVRPERDLFTCSESRV